MSSIDDLEKGNLRIACKVNILSTVRAFGAHPLCFLRGWTIF